MTKCLAIAMLLCTGAVSSAYAATDSCLSKATTQTAMNVCASRTAAAADRQLQTLYQQVLAAAKNDPVALKKLRAEEAAWAAYRDAYIAATYPAADKQQMYGSSYPMKADLLRAHLTQLHIADLQRLLQEQRGQ